MKIHQLLGILKEYGLRVLILVLIYTIAISYAVLSVRTFLINNDYQWVLEDERYSAPVYVYGVEVIKQELTCGYAVIEIFSSWAGKDITEESLYSEKAVTSTGRKFCREMNRHFPEYITTMHKYMKNSELLTTVYESLSKGIPVPFEWAAQYETASMIKEWTLHYSIIVGMDLPGDKITVSNPYGYVEEVSVKEFLNRTSFRAFGKMPLYYKLGFMMGIFEKNTVFIVE